MSALTHVSVLLLGSGWTSRFLLPLLQSRAISCAYTKRKSTSSDGQCVPFELLANAAGEEDAKAFEALPRADLLVIVFPLTSRGMVDRIVGTYERVKQCQPAWLALGTTGAWSKGISTSSTPTLETNARAQSESHLLSIHSSKRSTAVLNLSGLYGGERDPINFAKRVADSMEKLEGKTSLHLVHGKDVAQAVVGMWEALQEHQQRKKMWGKRWIVTDTHVYDWWQLCTTFKPPPFVESADYVRQLLLKHSIPSLPRPAVGQGEGERDGPPYVLDRVLDGSEFWNQLGKQPLVGRCDDYGPEGGGSQVHDQESSRQAL